MNAQAIEATTQNARYEEIRLALRWYFQDKGRGRRIARFALNVTLLMALTFLIATLVQLGASFLGTISMMHSDIRSVRELITHMLANTTALEYVRGVEANLLSHLIATVMFTVLVSVGTESYLTLRRAQRLMPPVEFVSAQLRKGLRLA
jgi:hypothetical protein